MKKIKLGLGVALTAFLIALGSLTVATAPKAEAMTGYHYVETGCVDSYGKSADSGFCHGAYYQPPAECAMGSPAHVCYHPPFHAVNSCQQDKDNAIVDNHFCDDPDPSTGGSTSGSSKTTTTDNPQTLVDECLSNHEISPSLTRAEKIQNAVAVEGASVPAPTEAEAGSCASTWGITADKTGVSVPSEYNGHHITFFIYSEPKFLGATVIENGRFNVDLSAFSGAHRIVLVNDDAQIVGETVANFGGEVKLARTTGSVTTGASISILLLTIISAAAALKVRKNNA